MPSPKIIQLLNFLCIGVLALMIGFAWHHPSLWSNFGIKVIHPEGFEDTRVITAGIESQRLGHDPQVSNIADPWQRGMNYPRLWLLLGKAGIGPENTRALALAFIALFILGLVLLSTDQTAHSFPVALLALSPAALLGVERGNNDLTIFAGLCCAVLLSKKHPNVAALLWLLLCALKLYPILAAPAIVGSLRRTTLIACVLALACYAVSIRDQLPAIMAQTPAFSLHSFGARTTLRLWDRYMLPGREIIWALSVALSALPFFLIRQRQCSVDEDSVQTRLFLAGGTLTCLGYLVFNSFDYRLVFAILCVPWLINQTLASHSYRALAALAGIALAMTMVATESALYKAGIQPVDFIPFTQAMRWIMFLTLAPLVLERLFSITGQSIEMFVPMISRKA